MKPPNYYDENHAKEIEFIILMVVNMKNQNSIQRGEACRKARKNILQKPKFCIRIWYYVQIVISYITSHDNNFIVAKKVIEEMIITILFLMTNIKLQYSVRKLTIMKKIILIIFLFLTILLLPGVVIIMGYNLILMKIYEVYLLLAIIFMPIYCYKTKKPNNLALCIMMWVFYTVALFYNTFSLLFSLSFS